MTLFGALAITLQSVQAVPVPTRSVTAAGHSSQAALSADGEWVVFCSTAPDLVADDTDGAADIFLRSRKLGTTVRISDNSSTTAQHPAISGDGNWITYWHGPWLVLHDRIANRIQVLHGDEGGGNWPGSNRPVSMSFDGARVAFTGRSEHGWQAQLWDRARGSVECISVSTQGVIADQGASEVRISSSGRFAVFCSTSGTLVPTPVGFKETTVQYVEQPEQVLLRDLDRHTTEFASHHATDALGFGGFRDAFVSDDGRFVAFNNRMAGLGLDNKIGFLSDLMEPNAGRLLEASRSVPRDATLEIRWLSRDGATAIVSSSIPDLDPRVAPTPRQKFFLHERANDSFRRIEHAAMDAAAGDDYPFIAFSEDGKTAAIASARSTLVPGDLNEDLDVFTVSLVDGTVELISVAARP